MPGRRERTGASRNHLWPWGGICLLALAGTMLAGCGGSGILGQALVPPVPLVGTEVRALAVTKPPVLDGNDAEQAWSNAPGTLVSLGEGMDSLSCARCHSFDSPHKVTLRAVHTSTDLYVWASWPDPTCSFTRSGSWSFEGGAWSKSSGQSEDRIAFFFPIGSIVGDFGADVGCMTKCHISDVHPGEGLEDEAYLNSGRADVWHMKAARSLPVNEAKALGPLTVNPATHEVTAGALMMRGWLDDKYIGQWSAGNSPDGGRYGDSGGSTYSHNRIGDKSRPKYMEKAPTDYLDAMVLTQAEIDRGEAVGDATTGVNNVMAAKYWGNYAALDAVIPERILRAPAGSRGDVVQVAKWSNGWWTTEIKRRLNTGNADDVRFVPGNSYLFGVAIMDNGGGDVHETSRTLTLKVE